MEIVMKFTEGEIEGEICKMMWRYVFCTHKPYFLMPGHINTSLWLVLHAENDRKTIMQRMDDLSPTF